jgi:threonine aldolase
MTSKDCLSLRRHFASDNYSGICPEALEAIAAANKGHVPSYGGDPFTKKVCDRLREVFETDCEVFFVFNGTAANSLALAALCQSYNSVICADVAHVETDECGAPEFFSNGTKILTVTSHNGKIDLNAVGVAVTRRTDIHYPKAKVLSMTQVTEVGTAYTVDEVRAVGETARKYGLHLQMDGSRFSNAVASLKVTPAELSWKAGVDVLCLGGTKNGLPIGEAIIFFNRPLAAEFEYRCKQAGQLASKMRFLAAPWLGVLENDVWLKNAAHSNKMAKLLEQELRTIPGVKIVFPVEGNSVFIETKPEVADAVRARGWIFYGFIGVGGSRLMCSWDTQESDVKALAKDLRECAAAVK